MNLGNLELNIKYKYKALCEVLNVEQKKSTNSKKAQLKEIQQYINVIKEGTWYTVVEIYSTPKEKIENRGKSEGSRNNHSIYANLIDTLLLDYLVKKRDNLKSCTIDATNNQIAVATGIVNRNYRAAVSNQKKFIKKINKDFALNNNRYCVYDTLISIKGKVRELVKGSLDRLQRKKILSYEYNVYITTLDESRQALPDELETIQNAEEKVLKEMQKEKKQIDNNEGLLKDYRAKVLKKIQKEFDYIISTYKGYTIEFITGIEPLADEEVNNKKRELNLLVLDYLYSQPAKKKDKTIKDRKNFKGFGKPREEDHERDRMNKSYIDYCTKIINLLCNLQANYIGNLLG